MKKETVNVLIWIPILGIFIGFYEFFRGLVSLDGSWFSRNGFLVSFANGAIHGTGLVLMLVIIFL